MKHTPHHTQKQNIAEATKALGDILDRPVSPWPAPLIGYTPGSTVVAVGRAVRKLSGATGQACALAGQGRWFAEIGTDACLMYPHLRRDEISNLVTELVEAAR